VRDGKIEESIFMRDFVYAKKRSFELKIEAVIYSEESREETAPRC